MHSDSNPVPPTEARTERVMILALLAIAALAVYGLFADTERAAVTTRMGEGAAPVTSVQPAAAVDAAR